jgi:hypothetical protein
MQGVLTVPLRRNVGFDDSKTIMHYLIDCPYERHARRGTWILRRCIMNHRIRKTELLLEPILRRHIFSIRVIQTELLLASILLNHVYEYRIYNIYLRTNKDVCAVYILCLFFFGFILQWVYIYRPN